MGRLVASALRYPFLDCDALIERAAGASVSQIFAEEGEEAFRDLETQVLQVCGLCVFSCQCTFNARYLAFTLCGLSGLMYFKP